MIYLTVSSLIIYLNLTNYKSILSYFYKYYSIEFNNKPKISIFYFVFSVNKNK